MADNIDIGPETVKTADLGAVVGDSIMTLSEAEFAERIERGARKIESLETTAILQIASEAAKIHGAFRYRRKEGGYAGYMKKRLGCSRSSAYRLLDVHARFGTNLCQAWDRLPVSALYLLAAPATPEKVVNEVAARIEAGEEISCVAVTAVIAQAKNETANSSGQDRDGRGRVDHVDAAAGGSAPRPSTIEEGNDGHGDIGAPAQQITTEPVATSAKHSLVKVWDEGAPEERAFIRDLVLEEFFAQTTGADIYGRIPEARIKEVVGSFLFKALHRQIVALSEHESWDRKRTSPQEREIL